MTTTTETEAVSLIEMWLGETAHRHTYTATDVADRLLDLLLTLEKTEPTAVTP